jgi:hypothetical protein
MTLLEQSLAAKHDIYFEDGDTAPGAEWASFLQKVREKTEQVPGVARAFSVGRKEGYPGGWFTGLESVSGGWGNKVPEDPLLKVMRRLDQSALMRELQESEQKRLRSAGETGASSTERGGPSESSGGLADAGGKPPRQKRFWKRNGHSVGNLECVTGYPPLAEAAKRKECQATADQLFMEAADRMLALLPAGLSLAKVFSQKTKLGRTEKRQYAPELEFREERSAIWSVVIDGESFPVWDGDEACIAAAVLDLYRSGSPWQGVASHREGASASYGALEAALQLFELLLLSVKDLSALGTKNRAIPSPLAPLVKALGKPLGKSMSPKVFRGAIEAGLGLVAFCKGLNSPGGIKMALTVVSLLKYLPQLSLRLAQPRSWDDGKTSNKPQKSVGAERVEVATKEEGEGKDILKLDVGITKSDVGSAKSDLGNANSDVGTAKPDMGTAKSNLSTAKPDVGTAKPDVGTAELDLGTAKLDVGTANLDVGTANLDVGTANPDVGTANLDVGSAKLVVGAAKSDVGTARSNVGVPKSDVGFVETDVGAAKTEVNGQGKLFAQQGEEEKAAAAEEVAYKCLSVSLAQEMECQCLGEKLAATAVGLVFMEPEVREATLAGGSIFWW